MKNNNMPILTYKDFRYADRMESINLWGFYIVGTLLERLRYLNTSSNTDDSKKTLIEVYQALDFLRSKNSFVKLQQSLQPIVDLMSYMNELYETSSFSQDEIKRLNELIEKFEIVFRHELPHINAYFVSPKRLFDTTKLVNHAEEILDEETRNKMPEIALKDIRSSGKCLAFSLSTASGFHILRALEAVVIKQIIKITSKEPEKNERNLGKYIEILRNNQVDQKVILILDQIRLIHRNPLMHPEDELSQEEALDLFSLCVSAISLTVLETEKIQIKHTSQLVIQTIN